MILPQFGGELLESRMEAVGDEGSKEYALHIDFGVSEEIKHLATIFNKGEEVGAFNKAAGDLFKDVVSVPEGELGRAATAIESGGGERTFEQGGLKLTMRKLQE
jgi:hypothetical protein